MTAQQFRQSLSENTPPSSFPAPLAALWFDAKGDWARAHDLVDSLETVEGMAVHAYLHRKGGEESNAEYWYRNAGREYYRENLEAEWEALVEGLLAASAGTRG